MKRRRHRNEVKVTLYDSEDREVQVVATYSPPTRDYYARDPGCWLPGDPESVEVLEVIAVDEGANTEEVENRTDEIEEAVRLAADDAAGEDEDAAYEAWKDRQAGF